MGNPVTEEAFQLLLRPARNLPAHEIARNDTDSDITVFVRDHPYILGTGVACYHDGECMYYTTIGGGGRWRRAML